MCASKLRCSTQWTTNTRLLVAQQRTSFCTTSRHQSTVKANSSTHQPQERPGVRSVSRSSAKQEHNATPEQQRTRPTNKGTMLDFLRPKTKNDAPTKANTVHTCTQNTKLKGCETGPHLTQCSINIQTTSTQRLTGKKQKAEGVFSNRCEELRLMTWNVMGTTDLSKRAQALHYGPNRDKAH